MQNRPVLNYMGVKHFPHGVELGGEWVCKVPIGSFRFQVGYYHTESDAAYAYNCALDLLGSKLAKNRIHQDDMPDTVKMKEIEAAVALALEHILAKPEPVAAKAARPQPKAKEKVGEV